MLKYRIKIIFPINRDVSELFPPSEALKKDSYTQAAAYCQVLWDDD